MTLPLHPDIDRRTMLSASVLAAAGLVLCGCGLGQDPTAPATITPLTLKVGDTAALATVGGVALVSAAGSPLAVVRTGQASFVALSRICPHQGATINVVAGGFLCPRHGAEFNDTGAHTGGQSTGNLTSYPAVYNASTDVLTIG